MKIEELLNHEKRQYVEIVGDYWRAFFAVIVWPEFYGVGPPLVYIFPQGAPADATDTCFLTMRSYCVCELRYNVDQFKRDLEWLFEQVEPKITKWHRQKSARATRLAEESSNSQP